jgi:hypothetical protein
LFPFADLPAPPTNVAFGSIVPVAELLSNRKIAPFPVLRWRRSSGPICDPIADFAEAQEQDVANATEQSAETA